MRRQNARPCAVLALAVLGLARATSAEQPCFPVSVEVRTEEQDGSVTGWASIDRTARFAGRSCQVKGWAALNSCGRTITAYLANCPDGAFTFTRTEDDCYYVLGCSSQIGAAGAAPRQ